MSKTNWTISRKTIRDFVKGDSKLPVLPSPSGSPYQVAVPGYQCRSGPRCWSCASAAYNSTSFKARLRHVRLSFDAAETRWSCIVLGREMSCAPPRFEQNGCVLGVADNGVAAEWVSECGSSLVRPLKGGFGFLIVQQGVNGFTLCSVGFEVIYARVPFEGLRGGSQR